VVATVPPTPGRNAQVHQGGVWSNQIPFQVATVTITEVLPNSGFPGDAIVINGLGCGNIQRAGAAQLGRGISVCKSEDVLAHVRRSGT
jgi:hypothetical protein